MQYVYENVVTLHAVVCFEIEDYVGIYTQSEATEHQIVCATSPRNDFQTISILISEPRYQYLTRW